MTKAAEKNQADLREQIAAQQRELDALRAKLKGMPEAGKAPPEEKGVVIEIDAEVLKSVRAMTDAQQKIVQTKRVKINVDDKITQMEVTLENKKITVPAPANLGEGQFVVIDLINKDGGKIITLAYEVKTNAQDFSNCAMLLRKKNSVSKKNNSYEESVKANRQTHRRRNQKKCIGGFQRDAATRFRHENHGEAALI